MAESAWQAVRAQTWRGRLLGKKQKEVIVKEEPA